MNFLSKVHKFSIPAKAIIENPYDFGQLFFLVMSLLEFSFSVFLRKKW